MKAKIVALGGTVTPASATEMALRYALRPAEESGADVRVFGGEYLCSLPHYLGAGHSPGDGSELVEAVRQADGVLIAAPGYHGTVSGLVKNALDYFEDLAGDERPYLDGRAVGLIACASGDQAAMGPVQPLRSIVHARKSVGSGKRVAVIVKLGGGRN